MNNSKIEYRNLLYPGILIIIAIGITTVTYFTVRFLTSNINAAFDINESALEASTIKVNKEDYKLAAKKLGIQYPMEHSPLTPLPVLEEPQ